MVTIFYTSILCGACLAVSSNHPFRMFIRSFVRSFFLLKDDSRKLYPRLLPRTALRISERKGDGGGGAYLKWNFKNMGNGCDWDYEEIRGLPAGTDRTVFLCSFSTN